MSPLKIVITGSTGMVGKGALLECIDSPEVEAILLVNRNPIDINHPKIKEIVIKDLFNLKPMREELKGYNTCFFCLGVTSFGTNEADYTSVMHDLTIVFAQEVLTLNPDITFCFVSGAGTDSTEKGNAMWARVKGKTENDLLKVGFKSAFMFRPGLIQPIRGIRSRTGWYNIFYTVTRPFSFLLRRLPKYVTNTVTMGKAMINVAMYGYPKNILESEDINILGAIKKGERAGM